MRASGRPVSLPPISCLCLVRIDRLRDRLRPSAIFGVDASPQVGLTLGAPALAWTAPWQDQDDDDKEWHLTISTMDGGYNGGITFVHRLPADQGGSWKRELEEAVAKAQEEEKERLLWLEHGHSVLSILRIKTAILYESTVACCRTAPPAPQPSACLTAPVLANERLSSGGARWPDSGPKPGADDA